MKSGQKLKPIEHKDNSEVFLKRLIKMAIADKFLFSTRKQFLVQTQPVAFERTDSLLARKVVAMETEGPS